MNKFAVFDIDGTLIRWQLYHTIATKLAKKGMLGPNAYHKITESRQKWKRRETNGSFREYELVVLHAYESALQKISVSQFEALTTEVIDEHKDQVYVYTRDLIKKLKAEGYFLLAISGSHHELVEQIATYYQFDDFLGTMYEKQGDLYNGEKFVPSQNKKAALQKLTTKHTLSFKDSIAIGDSQSDAAMLELVENPIAFNPDALLFTIAQEEHWKIVIERKNMIYELLYKDGNYVLA